MSALVKRNKLQWFGHVIRWKGSLTKEKLMCQERKEDQQSRGLTISSLELWVIDY